MIATKCLVCGSSNMRADRALSGRLVCNSCGTPFGVRRNGPKRMSKFNLLSLNKKYSFVLYILIVAIFLVII